MHGKQLAGALIALLASVWAVSASADSVDARCDIYPAGADHTDVIIPCHFKGG
jgi:hypothetical protein